MNVLFYYGSVYNGGAEKVITALANHMSSNGDGVQIVVTDDGKCGYDLSDAVRVVPLNSVLQRKNRFDSVKNFFGTLKSLRKRIKEFKPDVIVSFDPRYAFLAKLSCGKNCRRVVGSERSNPFAARKSAADKLFVKLSVFLNGFIFQTNGARSFYPEKTRKKSVVISNGVFEEIPASGVGFRERSRFGICASGRLSQVKRYDLMIRAVKELSAKYPDIELDIFGDGGDRQKIADMINEYGLEGKVVLKGRTMRIYDELLKYRYFLLTSDSEGMPNGLIDAMACGCVCVCSDCDFGPSELIRDGENGFLVPTGSFEKVAEKLEQLFETDDGELAGISDRASDIRVSLSKEKIVGSYYEYIKEIAKR
ncbi:MAG: glycosyltransferase [Clostridia bacterium]|nr:glycosyltransferase [Clostridia bacterium]